MGTELAPPPLCDGRWSAVIWIVNRSIELALNPSSVVSSAPSFQSKVDEHYDGEQQRDHRPRIDMWPWRKLQNKGEAARDGP